MEAIMPAEDLKSRTPGPLDPASQAFVERVRQRQQHEDLTGTDTEIDDTSLPLDDRGSDLAGTREQAGKDLEQDATDRPDSDNPDDAGEDESTAPLV